MAQIARTIVIDDVSPEELAELFAGMVDEDQARFFARVGEIADGWSGAGWCQQCCSISEHLDRKATETILKLAEWAADPYRPTPPRSIEGEGL